MGREREVLGLKLKNLLEPASEKTIVNGEVVVLRVERFGYV